MHDVNNASLWGALVLAVFTVMFLLLGRWRLLLLLPPVLIGTALAVGATVLVFGSIHGLTLSFGTGIVGLAIDYGLHAAFASARERVWTTNFYGLLTTLAGLVVLMFSSIPLLQQLMFFSSVGLVLSFVLLQILFKIRNAWFASVPFRSGPQTNFATRIVATILVFAGLVGFVKLEPTLSLRDMDYQSPETERAGKWLQESSALQPPVFQVHKGETFADLLKETIAPKIWSEKEKMKIESLANYIPDVQTQEANLQSWNCDSLKKNLTTDELNFFEPFIKSTCTNSVPIKTPSYLQHLVSENQAVTLWAPENQSQEELIRRQFPQSVSFREIAGAFPQTLVGELKWMVPVSGLLAIFLILLHFRSPVMTMFSLIPFLSGVGLLSIMIVLFKLSFSFISLIGLIMVFGLSIDYGIFVSEAQARKDDQENSGTWSAVTLAALTTVAGFVPMLFCRHPVLQQLGQALFYGTLGTYIGAFWGIPSLAKWTAKV
jgi:hypothetical protein